MLYVFSLLVQSTFGNAEKEIAVIGDLMTYFMWLFDVSEKEWAEEEKKVKKLTEIQQLFKAKPKVSGTFLKGRPF